MPLTVVLAIYKPLLYTMVSGKSFVSEVPRPLDQYQGSTRPFTTLLLLPSHRPNELYTQFQTLYLHMDLLQDPPDLNHPLNLSNGLFLEAIRHSKHTTRDQRRDVQLLHRKGFTQAQIAAKQDLTVRQVRYAIHHPPTPQKRAGRPGKITPEELAYLIQWIYQSKANRRCR
jgi:hypothetical protein